VCICTYIYTDIHMFFQDVMDDGLDMKREHMYICTCTCIYIYIYIYICTYI
jgi:hypothetical protein